MAQITQADGKSHVAKGVLIGTPVMTAEGALPVEYLFPGDRIVTRAGMRQLISVEVSVVKNLSVLWRGQVVLTEARRFRLVFDEDAVIYAGGVEFACPVAPTF